MNVKNLLLGIVIAVIFLMFFVYGTKLVYEDPKYEDFCNQSYYYPEKIVNCSFNSELQKQMTDCYNQRGTPRYEYDTNGCEKSLTCDLCSLEYENANKDYSKNLFLISLIVGIIVIAVSVILIKVSAVSGGLMLGSLFFIIYGTTGYWQFMEDVLRFVILGLTLFILIWLAYYLARKDKKENKKKKIK
jgi:ABC-type antimicrobial peptide transport system permease subunit